MIKALFSFISACSLLTMTILGSYFVLVTHGCKKEEPVVLQEKTFAVTYRVYSTHQKFVFGHVEDDVAHTGAIDTIRTNEYTVVLQVKENALDCYQYVQSVAAYPSDSLFIRAEYDGKWVQTSHGYTSGGSIFSQSIQLSQAK